jgi:hypothetical protein
MLQSMTATRPQRPSLRLPTTSTDGPLVVSLDEARFPVSLTFLAENAWSIHEAIGSEHVAHGRLHYSRGRFAIMTAAGRQTYGPSWQAAVTAHLYTR